MSDDLPLVIVNPTAAANRTGARWAGMASDLRTHFGAFRVEFTRARGDARRLARAAAEQGTRFIIACGGDGTINEVANGILESGGDAELGVLPSGTGGDFRRTLGLPTSTREAAHRLRTGHTLRVDIGRATYTNDAGVIESRYFVGVASAGASAAVIERLKQSDAGGLTAGASRLLGGKLGFGLATLRTAMEFERPLVSVQLDDGEPHTLRTLNLCVCNARYFGGGMMIAPGARMDDNLFDVVALGDIDRSTIISRSYKLYRGTHLTTEMVHHKRARRVRLLPESAGEIVRVEADGEIVGRLPATFEIAPAKLYLRCPVKSPAG